MAIKESGFTGKHSSKRDILGVSELNRKAKQLLETHFSTVWVQGELSNFARPQSGHWYFTLKDDKAQLRCAMFRNRNQLMRYSPREGEQVLVRGRLSLYEGRGDYQLVAAFMEPAGEGALRLALEQLKLRLENEGLFDQETKLLLPAQLAEIVVITSPTGAALHDILTVLRRRSPTTAVTILPVAVQGDQAAGQIVQALQFANNSKLTPDAIILARGGGSIEDLWPFNDEAVARAIFASHIPIVSAVGHETDFSISDFVADLRAPTPSAAAELLSQDNSGLLAKLELSEAQLIRLMTQRIATERLALANISRHLRHPQHRLEELAQRGDELAMRLQQAVQRKLHACGNELLHTHTQLNANSPVVAINEAQLRLEIVVSSLRHAMQSSLKNKRALLQSSAAVLDAISPLATLGRGYAIVRDAQHQVVKESSAVNIGAEVTAQLAQGTLRCEVKGESAA
ncbi:MAG: exodeoxyribonuclease VII large subunit [Pseudomonadales bacterium]